MADSSEVRWLQSIESNLERAIADLTVQYRAASLKNRPRVYMVLAKLRERRTTVNDALIDVLQERIRIQAPSAETIADTLALADKLQVLIRKGVEYDAMLGLLSEISVLVTKTIMEPSHV
ncbi:MAG: hypothetical protein V4484_24120 [Pseudomonadota bacterium]